MNSLTRALVVFLSLGPASFAAPHPAFKFDAKSTVPALSILDGTKEGPSPLLNDTARFFQREAPPPKTASKVVSQMPMISPNPAVDYSLRVIAPDDAVEYKMIIKSPDVEVPNR